MYYEFLNATNAFQMRFDELQNSKGNKRDYNTKRNWKVYREKNGVF